jgi:hypothetical protein
MSDAGQALLGRESECAAGVESEMELAFAGLQQLCWRSPTGWSGLPGPQRDAAELLETRNHLAAGGGVFALSGAAAVAQIVFARTAPWARRPPGRSRRLRGCCCW